MISWRNATIVLALVCCIQRWQSCTHEPVVVEHVVEAPATKPSGLVQAFAAATDRPVVAKRSFFGFKPPMWAQGLLPQAGENLLAYRDRILPLAQTAIAPQRARVAKLRDHLPETQRVALDAAVADTAKAIEDRVAQAVLGGELQQLKPMTGVAMARELLDIVDRGNSEFVSSLSADARAQLAASKFDFADYLVFGTKWEDALPGAMRR